MSTSPDSIHLCVCVCCLFQAGYTPLHYACLAGQDEAAMMLRRCDTDVTIVNRANHTALQCAASTGNRALAVRIDRYVQHRVTTAQDTCMARMRVPLTHAFLAVALVSRAIGVREEAVLRAKRFYVHLFEGNEDYWKDPVEDRCPDFFTGRLLGMFSRVTGVIFWRVFEDHQLKF